VLRLHILIRLQQHLKVNTGRRRRVHCGFVPTAGRVGELQPKQPELRDGGEAILKRMVRRRLREEHEDPPEGFEEEWMGLWLEQLEAHVREDWRLE